MPTGRRAFLKLLALAGLAGCTPAPRLASEGFLLYGMLTTLTLPETTPLPLAQALSEVEAIFRREYALLHPWQDSPLARLNAALPSGDWVPLDPRLRPLILRGQALERATAGAFSPAIGALVRLWGFHSGHPEQERTPPAEAEIQRLLHPPPRMSDLELEDGRIRCHNPNVQLDFNAMAEGWAAEKAMQRLAELGVTDALLDASGDLLLRGQAGPRPWRVAIQDPFREAPLGSLELTGPQAVFTSGSYRKRFTYQGVSYNHIIDPRSGWPTRGLVTATVLAEDPLLANAATTGLMVTGLDGAPALVQRLGLTHVLLVDEQGVLHTTPPIAKQLQRVNTPSPLMPLPVRA